MSSRAPAHVERSCGPQLVGAIALLLLLPRAALADPVVSTEAATQTPAGDHAATVHSPGARGDGIWRFRVSADYTREPLVLVVRGERFERAVVEQLWLEAAASLALEHRYLLAVAAPVLALENGESAPGEAALGDPRLLFRARLVGGPKGPSGGAGLELWLPLATRAYAGDGALRARPFIGAGHEAARWAASGNLGLLWRKDETLQGIVPTRVGSAASAGANVSVALDAAARFWLGPEVTGLFTISNGASLLDQRSTAVGLLLHARHRLLGGPFELSASAGPSFGQLPGSADYRLLFALAFSPEEAPPPPDADGDTVPDEEDMCPSLAGVPSNDPLMHGCPELPTDSDGDGVPDIYDACPQTPGIATGVQKTHGCPRGTKAESPAPPPAPPTPPPKAELVSEQIVISEQVLFETGTAELKSESDAILQQVATVLLEHPELRLVEVAGHTDDTGTPELNDRLSLDRAQAVVAWLVARGIAAERLQARGYGQSRPLLENTSEEARAKNRRVEFHVLERGEK